MQQAKDVTWTQCKAFRDSKNISGAGTVDATTTKSV